MKRNDFVQIKGSDLKELKLNAGSLRSEIANLTLDKNMKKIKDLKIVAKKKKDLAQVLTVIRQKELLVELESKVKIKEPGKKSEEVAQKENKPAKTSKVGKTAKAGEEKK